MLGRVCSLPLNLSKGAKLANADLDPIGAAEFKACLSQIDISLFLEKILNCPFWIFLVTRQLL